MPYLMCSATIAVHALSFSKTTSRESARNAGKWSRMIGRITDVSFGARLLLRTREIFVQSSDGQRIESIGVFNQANSTGLLCP